MSFPDRYSVLLDGEWVKKSLQQRLKSFPKPSDITSIVDELKKHDELSELSLYRVFYYTADPLTGTYENPISKSKGNFGSTPQHTQNRSLIENLELQPDFAVRRGQLRMKGWVIKNKSMEELGSGRKTTVDEKDLVPNIQQKGVDMCIGIDLTVLATKRLVSTVVIATGDTDLIPAFKLARTEGLRVHLATLGNPIGRDLRVHADSTLP